MHVVNVEYIYSLISYVFVCPLLEGKNLLPLLFVLAIVIIYFEINFTNMLLFSFNPLIKL